MKPGPQFIIYLVGVLLLGLAYAPVKSALGSELLFLGCAVAYLLGLRLLGGFVARTLVARKQRRDA